MLKHIVEGWSKESCEKALENALEQATHITRALHNPHVILKDLQYFDEKGFMAQLEISTEGVGLHEDYDLKDAFELTGPGSAEKFRTIEKEERERFERALANFLAEIGQLNGTFYVPDFILVPLKRMGFANRPNAGSSLYESLTGKKRRQQQSFTPDDDPD